jgi:hypothetical protein
MRNERFRMTLLSVLLACVAGCQAGTPSNDGGSAGADTTCTATALLACSASYTCNDCAPQGTCRADGSAIYFCCAAGSCDYCTGAQHFHCEGSSMSDCGGGRYILDTYCGG